MKAKRRKFTGAFKAQVAIEALKERKSLAELSKEYDVHPNIITKWKREFLERSAIVFELNLQQKTRQLIKPLIDL